MKLCAALLALVSASVALAGEVQSTWKECPHKLKEQVIPPHRWEKVRPAPPEHRIELKIGLVQPNFAELERHLYEVRYVFRLLIVRCVLI